jgi:hypothetical protein
MKTSGIKLFLILLSGIILLQFSGCGGGETSTGTPGVKFSGDDNQITQFSFTAIGNKSSPLTSDVIGSVQGTSITCSVPKNTDRKSLIADFLSNSKKVTVSDQVQINGVTANDFTSPVVYKVYASDGSYQEYTVTLSNLPGTDKSITAFSIAGAKGTIDQSAGTIKVTLDPKSEKKSQITSFSASGVSVTVNGIAQESAVTANDYSSPVEYVVTAEDGSTSKYIVTVDVALSSEKDINSFIFRSSENESLGRNITGIISGDSINAVIPYGKSPSQLKACFQTTGASVKVNNIVQESAVTENNFSSPVAYRITAENGSSRDYTVTVSVAKNDSKELTSFTLAGERGKININAKSISVIFPSDKNLTSMVGTYNTTGASVLISEKEQVSGKTANDFTSPVTYTVRAEDGSEQPYIVTALKSAEIPGMWNFDSVAGEGYTLSGAIQVPGLEGNALQFDGLNDYILIKDNTSLTLAASGSLEIIFKIKSYTPFAGLIHKGVKTDFTDESYSLQFWSDNVLRMILTNNSGKQLFLDSAGPLKLEKWYHVVSTWDAAKFNLYIDGSLVASTNNTIGSIMDSEGGFVIGSQLAYNQYNNTYGNFCFNGIIDRVVTYNRPLSSEEADSHYRQFFVEQKSGLSAYIPRAGGISTIIILVSAVLVSAALILLRRFSRKSELNG